MQGGKTMLCDRGPPAAIEHSRHSKQCDLEPPNVNDIQRNVKLPHRPAVAAKPDTSAMEFMVGIRRAVAAASALGRASRPTSRAARVDRSGAPAQGHWSH